MQELIVHIPFNRDAYLDNQRVAWQLMYREVSGSYYIYRSVTVVVLAVAFAVDLKGGFPLTTVIGIAMLIRVLFRFWQVNKVKRHFFARAEELALEYEQKLGDPTYTLKDDALIYQDKCGAKTYRWDMFDTFICYRNTMILKLRSSDEAHTIISAQDVDEQTYLSIYNIFLNKIGLDT